MLNDTSNTFRTKLCPKRIAELLPKRLPKILQMAKGKTIKNRIVPLNANTTIALVEAAKLNTLAVAEACTSPMPIAI